MLFELRLAVDDRPGSLARLTAVLAHHAVDVREIDFLGNVVGAAVDDVLIEATAEQLDAVRAALAAVPGFDVLSVRPSARLGGTQPQLELLLAVAVARGRGLETFTQLCPRAFGADWAAAFTEDASRPLWRTPLAPQVERVGRSPLRAAAIGLESGQYKVSGPSTTELAHTPLGEGHILLLGRNRGPTFHPLELIRLNRLVEVAVAIADTRSRSAEAITVSGRSRPLPG